jgi:hypothetical protein
MIPARGVGATARQFMVNTLDGGSYKVDLMRIIDGESMTKYMEPFN